MLAAICFENTNKFAQENSIIGVINKQIDAFSNNKPDSRLLRKKLHCNHSID